MRSITEILVIVLVIAVFGALVMKYFFNNELHLLPAQAANTAKMELRYRSYVSQHAASNRTPGTAHSIPILLYHGIADKPYKTDVLTDEFSSQMFALKRAGYQTVTLQEFEDWMAGKRQLPDRSFLITFDDGIKTSYYNTDPVLRALNYSAVMFLISKYNLLDQHPYYLSRAEVEHMQQSGRWELEAHAQDGHGAILIQENGTLGNFLANKQWFPDEGRLETDDEYRQRINNEFQTVKDSLEAGFGLHINAYAYPFGNFGQDSDNYPEAGNIVWSEAHRIYPYTFYQWWPSKGFRANYADPDEYRIRRVIVYSGTTGDALVKTLEAVRDKELPYQDELGANHGWVVTWGDMTLSNGTMLLRQVNVSPGSMTFLDGTALWKDYEFTAHVASFTGENAGLLGMYRDNDNYLMCDFSHDAVRVWNVVDNQTSVLAMRTMKDAPYALPQENFTLGMRASDGQIGCAINGEQLVSASLPLGSGGIGFRLSEKPAENGIDPGTLVIDSLSVEPTHFSDSFDTPSVLEETGRPGESPDPDWWLNSGGMFIRQGGVGSTLEGPTAPETKWQLDYANYNPTDTENGEYPQNIFRLITKSRWVNFRQEVYFRMGDYRVSDSPRRNESNGVLLFSRYADSDNLYYAGVRVDGAAVVKKKSNGEYHELAYQNAFPGVYDFEKNPNLLPKNTWIGLRTDTVTMPDGSVRIQVFLDKLGNGAWELATEGIDDETKYGPEIVEPGSAGIRTDFMDVEFDNYRITKT